MCPSWDRLSCCSEFSIRLLPQRNEPMKAGLHCGFHPSTAARSVGNCPSSRGNEVNSVVPKQRASIHAIAQEMVPFLLMSLFLRMALFPGKVLTGHDAIIYSHAERANSTHTRACVCVGSTSGSGSAW